MKTFEQWLAEEMQAQQPQTQTQQAQQHQQAQQAQNNPPPQQSQQAQNTEQDFIIHIPPGQEAQFSNRLLQKVQQNEPDFKNEFKTVFDTAKAYLLRSGGQRTGEINNFFKRLNIAALKNTVIGKYFEDGNLQMNQNREWNGEMPNLLMYDPSWASRSFKDVDPETLMQALNGLAAQVGQITQGKTQSSVFNQG